MLSKAGTIASILNDKETPTAVNKPIIARIVSYSGIKSKAFFSVISVCFENTSLKSLLPSTMHLL
jgi:hypothetical protein